MSVKLKEIEDGYSLIGGPPGHIVYGAAVGAVYMVVVWRALVSELP